MELTSTAGSGRYTWSEAVLAGLAPDGHLYIPREIPLLTPETLEDLRNMEFSEIASTVSKAFIGREVDPKVLSDICADAFNFPVPLVTLNEKTSILELFHGPTCAFKDFGARFMARLFRHFLGSNGEKLTVLVATSGDTGSAVANAFLDTAPDAPISVIVLFPKGKVSLVQEKQMTTLGHNVRAFEVEGTFDDCQRLVKQAMGDQSLTKRVRLTSANSINIARLLPQSFYYLWASSRLPFGSRPLFSVPSGNLGNLTAGVLAHLMGMQVDGFIAAHNANDVFPRFLAGDEFTPRPSIETVSNAMDVGNPSNYARLNVLFGASRERMTNLIRGASFDDTRTIEAMRTVYEQYGYMLDPHGAVGYLALQSLAEIDIVPNTAVVVGTAHPAKFPDAAKRAFGKLPELPPQLRVVIDAPGTKSALKAEYSGLANVLQA